jgi:hypothetical protein
LGSLKPICEKLREVGSLFSLKMFDHSYMHCWRHKTPIIYRAIAVVCQHGQHAEKRWRLPASDPLKAMMKRRFLAGVKHVMA